jgi:hypothetical protein
LIARLMLLALLLAPAAAAAQQRLPILDMHLHVRSARSRWRADPAARARR